MMIIISLMYTFLFLQPGSVDGINDSQPGLSDGGSPALRTASVGTPKTADVPHKQEVRAHYHNSVRGSK